MSKKNPVLHSILETIKRHKGLVFVLFFTVCGTILLGVMPPLVLEKAVNFLTQENGEEVRNKLLTFGLLYFFLTVIGGLFDGAKEGLITVFGQKVTHNLRSDMAEKLYRLPANYYVKNEPGVTTSKFVNDVNTVESLFASGVISMVVDFCKVISILVVIFAKSRGLGVLLLIVTPFLLFLTNLFQKRMLQAQMKNRIAVGENNRQIPETLHNFRTIRLLEKENYMAGRYRVSLQNSFQAMEQSNFYDAIYSPIIITCSALLVGIMMALSGSGGAFQAFFGMSVGTAVAVIAYVGKVFEPLESIGMEIQNIQSAVAGVKRINGFLIEQEREVFAVTKTEQAAKEENVAIRVSNVTFGYDRSYPVLKNRSFLIEKGEMVTIAGRTGIGKSTLFKLLLGLYQPDAGEIRIFGTAPEKLSESERKRIFGYVEQEFHQVPGTVKDQITLKDPEITEKEVEEALRLVDMWEAVKALPGGIMCPCTTALFSKGQFQLLSIARAIVRKPQILLLDEITSNLDSDMEERVMTALKAAAADRTVLSISHRLYERQKGRLLSFSSDHSHNA